MKVMLLSGLCALWGASCATHEVDKTLKLRGEKAGESFAEEVLSQSPLKPVKMSWREAKELMKERNLAFGEALVANDEASVRSPYLSGLVSELKGSLSDTVVGALSPKELMETAKSPVEEIPKHFENLASVKDFSHKMQLQAYENAKDSSVSEFTLRQQEIRLYLLFRQSALLKKRKKWLTQWESQEQLSPKLISLVKKQRGGWQKEQKAWVNAVRDFFNAEFADVKFTDAPYVFPTYKSVHNPHFTDWRRWRVLPRSKRLAQKVKEEHVKNKPVVPGMNFVKNRLRLKVDDHLVEETLAESDSLRTEVRSLLKNWRLLKEAQEELAILEKELETHRSPVTEPTDNELMQKLKLQSQWLATQKKILSLCPQIWLMDEKCWG